ncbi:transcription initiation protein [Corallococcus praedator]|uniref:Transcription initiation protein n=1 Tax=Corallococcus praedator TaxID=2316724 RepID=A0ABX9QE40_9BACT|nr:MULTISPECIES: YciI family protein [Corallococcus]RKH15624.1 transcription initiation protein [Corallococcus sp. CA047B]RKH24082.1 transcription initiation protein [Corallococcus sp. CA031C]RKI00706.1 transcription initiation protein [Corallococcus praedator]
MSRYLMLLHETPAHFAAKSPAELQAIVEEYIQWSDRLRKEGRLLLSEKLVDEGGKRLKQQGGQLLVSDGPYAEVKDVVGGLFILSAESYDDAVALARTCPHLLHGEVELRAIDDA